jgi:hypothetical protein
MDKVRQWIEIIGLLILAVYTGFTIGLFFETKAAVKVANDTLATSKQQFTNEQRPNLWVTMSGPSYTGGRVRVDVEIVNYGKSPALDVTWRHHLSIFSDAKIPVDERIRHAFSAIPPDISGYSAFIPPTGQPYVFESDIEPPLANPRLSIPQLSYIQSSALGWVEAGTVTYTDTTGSLHGSTKYCWPYFPGGAQHDCGSNNEVK